MKTERLPKNLVVFKRILSLMKINKEKFLGLISDEKTDTVQQNRE
jgi:hypothetical protein